MEKKRKKKKEDFQQCQQPQYYTNGGLKNKHFSIKITAFKLRVFSINFFVSNLYPNNEQLVSVAVDKNLEGAFAMRTFEARFVIANSISRQELHWIHSFLAGLAFLLRPKKRHSFQLLKENAEAPLFWLDLACNPFTSNLQLFHLSFPCLKFNFTRDKKQ